MKRIQALSFILIFILLITFFIPNTRAENISVDLNLPAGWSMISLPVLPEQNYVSSLFPGAVVVYGYEKGAGYVRIEGNEALKIGKGYWILINDTQDFTLTGIPIHSYILPGENGWLMIGGCAAQAQISVEDGEILVVYGYVQGTGYKRLLKPEKLEPCEGYWILLSNTNNQSELKVDDRGGTIICTDIDGDDFAIEAGLCGPVDCDDTDPNVSPNAPERCNNIDDNCNDSIDEGENLCSEIPYAKSSCLDGECIINSCDYGYADCDSQNINGCEVRLIKNLGNCPTSSYLGYVCGDENHKINLEGHGEERFSIYLEECEYGFSSKNLSIRVILYSPYPPFEVDYNLFLYGPCNSLIKSSVYPYSTDIVEDVIVEDFFAFQDDTKEFFIEIRYGNGSSCEPWKLEILTGY